MGNKSIWQEYLAKAISGKVHSDRWERSYSIKYHKISFSGAVHSMMGFGGGGDGVQEYPISSCTRRPIK